MADKKVEPEESEEVEELTLEQILYHILQDIDKQIGVFDEEMKEVEKAAQAITKMVYAPLKKGQVPPELVHPGKFRKNLDKLHGGLGKTIDYIVRVEKSRKMIERIPIQQLASALSEIEPETVTEPSTQSPSSPSSPINVTVTNPGGGPTTPSVQKPGFWWAYAERKKAEVWAKVEFEKMKGQTVVTTKQVVDIVQFGRQLIPAFNKVKKWIPSALALIRQFKNDSLYFMLHEEIGTYLSQTLGSLVSFVGACIEYRKNLLEGRKLGMARAIAKIAEAQSFAPTIHTGGAPFSPSGFKIDKKGFKPR